MSTSPGARPAERASPRAVGLLDLLLRGEMVAVASYERILDSMAGAPEASALRSILEGHRNARRLLREQVCAMGRQPSDHFGVAGLGAAALLAREVTAGDPARDRRATLQGLRVRESQACCAYEAAIDAGDVPAPCRHVLERTLLPRQWNHLAVLDRQGSVAKARDGHGEAGRSLP